MSNIYAKLKEIAKRDFPKISGEAVSKIVRETVRETEDLCNEGLANGLVSDPSSVLKLLKERYNIEGDSKYAERTYKELTRGKKHPTELEKLSAVMAFIGTFKLTAELVRYELESR